MDWFLLRFLLILTRTSLKNKKSLEVRGMETWSAFHKFTCRIDFLYRMGLAQNKWTPVYKASTD